MTFLAVRSDKRFTLCRKDGASYALYRDQFDVPTEYDINGTWLPEGHPEVISAMREWIEGLKARPGQRSPEEISEIISDLEWVISRAQQGLKGG
jgi:hypothetical protein